MRESRLQVSRLKSTTPTGAATSSRSDMSAPQLDVSRPAEEVDSQLSPALAELSNLLASKEYVLATAQGDGELSTKALNAVKSIFDLGKSEPHLSNERNLMPNVNLGISLEHQSHPHLHPLLTSVIEPPSHSTRSKAAAKKGKKGSVGKEDAETKDEPVQTAESLLPYTPLDGLYTDGMNFAQIWQQLELRSGKLGEVLKVVGIESQEPRDDDDDAGMNGEDSDSENSESEDEEDDDLDFEGLDDEQKAMWLDYLKQNPDEFVEKYEDDGEEMDSEDGSGEDDSEEEDGSDIGSDEDEDMSEDEEELSGEEDITMEDGEDEVSGESEEDEEDESAFNTRRGPQ